MKHIILLVCAISIQLNAHVITKIPQLHGPGLLLTDDVISLSQADFASGTYRITKSGYYYLAEDIAFNPDPTLEAKRNDKPLVDEWFTALSIECDNVIIDLNTKTFYAHKDFLNKQLLKVFSLIEIGNMPFPNIKKEFGFNGVTTPLYPKNITIKNGTIGASPHHGIHGNNNVNIQLYDLTIRDWEVAGIAFNGLKNGVIKNINISGMEHEFSFTGLVSVMLVARFLLEQRVAGGDLEAQKYIEPLNNLIADPTQNGSIHPSGLNYGNTYGIFLNRTFDIGPIISGKTPISTNTVLIEDVRISGIKIDALEAIVIGDAKGIPIAPDLFGSMRWQDAYQNGIFAPNALLRAQVYILHKKAPATMPTGFADNILSGKPDELLFLNQARPVFNRDFPIHAQKGIFGIRVDAGHGITIRNCSIMGLENVGKPGATLADIPSGNFYQQPASNKYTVSSNQISYGPGRYTGNDIYGISLSVCDNCTISNCDVSSCNSINGYVYGICVQNQSEANAIDACKVSGLRAQRDDTISVINPSSKVYGYYCTNKSSSIHITDCIAQNLQAERFAYGIYIENCRDTLINNALCSNNVVKSEQNLNAPKYACGIASLGNHGLAIRNSIVREMECTQEQTAASSSSYAVGYFFDASSSAGKDLFGLVDTSIAECNNGGKGIAAGIYAGLVDSFSATGNTISNNKSLMKKGYGIQKTKQSSNILVLRNVAYGNNKNYESGTDTWPLLELTSSSTHSRNVYNPWYNISITN